MPYKCLTCKYFDKEPLQPKVGACRRHIPLPLLVPTFDHNGRQTGAQLIGAFPAVKETDWCGEHESSIEEPAK